MGSGRVPEIPTEQRLTKLGRNIAETGAMVRRYREGKRTVNGIDTAAEYTDGVCSRSLVFLIAGTLALTND